MKRAAPEQQLHRAVADFLALALPEDAWFTTFPAGGGGRIRGALLRSMGLRAGVPDILVIYRGIAFWMELKAPVGQGRAQVSAAQRATWADLQRARSTVALVRSVDEAQLRLEQWGVPLRTRLAA